MAEDAAEVAVADAATLTEEDVAEDEAETSRSRTRNKAGSLGATTGTERDGLVEAQSRDSSRAEVGDGAERSRAAARAGSRPILIRVRIKNVIGSGSPESWQDEGQV